MVGRFMRMEGMCENMCWCWRHESMVAGWGSRYGGELSAWGPTVEEGAVPTSSRSERCIRCVKGRVGGDEPRCMLAGGRMRRGEGLRAWLTITKLEGRGGRGVHAQPPPPLPPLALCPARSLGFPRRSFGTGVVRIPAARQAMSVNTPEFALHRKWIERHFRVFGLATYEDVPQCDYFPV